MARTEPTYSFTIPSRADNTSLDCRIYHPTTLTLQACRKGAIFAHPYAPLGGNYDDAVVLSTTETLLSQGFIVTTFNFRGAGASQGRTSWTGKGEVDDYLSVLGCLVYYLFWLTSPEPAQSSIAEAIFTSLTDPTMRRPLKILCGGYSYGALILARLSPPEDFVTDIFTASPGSNEAEIVLRARALASQTRRAFSVQTLHSPRVQRSGSGEVAPHTGISVTPATIGGDESPKKGRARSRSQLNGHELIRRSLEAPQRVMEHVRRHSHDKKSRESSSLDSNHSGTRKESVTTAEEKTRQLSASTNMPPAMELFKFIVSPVLIPFSITLLPPGTPTSFPLLHRRQASDAQASHAFLSRPTLAVFGTADTFTSGSRLRAWAEQQAIEAPSSFQWEQIPGAGHFWHERQSMQALQQRLKDWSATL